MRSVALLFALFFSAAVPMAGPASAVESKILDTFKSWLSDEPDINDLDGLRRLAAKENPEAQFLLFEHYISHSRQGAGVRVASETLASRAEGEAGLRAAAEKGHPEAVSLLGAMLARGGPLLQNHAEARKWLEIAIEKGAPERRTTVEYLLAEILLFSPDATDADRQRGFAMAEDLLPRDPGALRHKANALRRGAGVAQDAEAARRILEEGVTAGNEYAPAPLGEMLVNGEGGPQDIERGIELLSGEAANRGLGHAILGELYLEGRLVGPNPRKGIELMAPYAVNDFERRQRLAGLLVDYSVSLTDAGMLFQRMQEDEDAGAPEAAWALLRLLEARREQFRDDELIFEVIERNKGKDDRIALADAEYLASWSQGDSQAKDLFGKNARNAIDALAEKGLGAAWTLKGQLQRKGWVYPQDDVAATESLLKAAELGDLEGMIELAEAYDEGLGVPENPGERLRWLRTAAAQGSVEARKDLVWQFKFDTFERKMTLREGLTDVVALYGDGLGYIDSLEFSSLLMNSRLDDFQREEVIAAFMDGFRAAPAALEEDRLLPMLKNLDEEVKAEIEAVLKKDGFYSGEPEGYFRPDARAALAAWTKAKGPLPPAEIPVEKPPAVRPAIPDIPAEILNTALRRAFEKVDTAKTDAEWKEALAMLGPLARLGDPVSRWLLVRWYDQTPIVGEAVTPEELTRYSLDILLLKDPQMQQAEMEVTFALTELWKANQGEALAGGFLAVLRDDERLQDELVLEDVLHQMLFIPGACEMLLAGATRRGVEGLPTDRCDSPQARDALLTFALAAGPSGVETGARTAAVADIYKIAGAPVPQQ